MVIRCVFARHQARRFLLKHVVMWWMIWIVANFLEKLATPLELEPHTFVSYEDLGIPMRNHRGMVSDGGPICFKERAMPKRKASLPTTIDCHRSFQGPCQF